MDRDEIELTAQQIVFLIAIIIFCIIAIFL